jgi:hydroxymethylglutaryl-CoA reductase
MALHARQVAIAAGAIGDEVDWVAEQMVAERAVRLSRAQTLLVERRKMDKR